MKDIKLQRLGTIMEPEPGNPAETEGVLNPAAVRGPDGELYLFPRLVGAGNYSRIGVARVIFNGTGTPVGVRRLGIALEPEAPYEIRADGGGCEDPRIAWVEPLQRFVMTYTAFSPEGPRIAMAQSQDLIRWERSGLAHFSAYEHIDLNGINNKDACIFPAAIDTPHGHRSLAMLHRPLFPGTRPEELRRRPYDREIREHQESIWISYIHDRPGQPLRLSRFVSNHPLAIPEAGWEKLKIGAGTPPVLTKYGWLMIYHGVQELSDGKLCYSAGMMILDRLQPLKIVYRSAEPIMMPELLQETVGTVANVVFPTGIDCRHDLGRPDLFDIYYGMADNRIGVARLELPDDLLA